MQENGLSPDKQALLNNAGKIIHGKWSMRILGHLTEGPLRFSVLKRKIPEITDANLVKELRQLERSGLVHREIFKEVPLRVEYSLTPIGVKFIPVLDAVATWIRFYQSAHADSGE